MLAVCPGCAEIHDGVCEHCDECYSNHLRPRGQKRSSAVAKLISPTPTQRESLDGVLQRMDADQLRDVLMRMLCYLPAIERSALIEIACEVAGVEWRPKCR